jgi:lipoprotein-anchoring transpeptidase ErfK/SrfK
MPAGSAAGSISTGTIPTSTVARLEVPTRPEPAWSGATPVASPTHSSPPDDEPGLARGDAPGAAPSSQPTPSQPPQSPPTPSNPPSPGRHNSRKPRFVDLGDAWPAGAIIVVNEERALYHVGMREGGKSIRYPVAIGAPDEMWTGIEFVADKRTNPRWIPVAADGKPSGEPIEGGDPANPLGKHALYLGRTLWRIHGTIAPSLIGAAASNGCIRMHNNHIAELYDRVSVGTEVFVVDSLKSPPPTHRGRKIDQISGN